MFTVNTPAAGTGTFTTSDTTAGIFSVAGPAGSFVATFPDGASATFTTDNTATGCSLGAGRCFAQLGAGFIDAGAFDFSTASVTGSTTIHAAEIERFGVNNGLTYSDYGVWLEYPGSTTTGVESLDGYWATGIRTLASDMPTSGTATYNGSAGSNGGMEGTLLYKGNAYVLHGVPSLTATFSASGGTISGSVSSIQAWSVASGTIAGPVNTINLTGGSITSTAFAGTAAAASTIPVAPAGQTALNIAGTTGTFAGAFYGPRAAEIAGTLIMQGATAKVLGAFGAKSP